MGNWNPKYFEKKSGSLEEAILNAVNGVKSQIDEKVSYVEYKFKNEKDAMKAKLFYDGLQRMGFEVNDDNISGGELMVDAGKNDMTQYHKQIMQKYKPKVMTQEKMDAVGKEDGDIDNDGDKDASDKYLAKRRKTIAKAMKKEAQDGGDFKPHMMYDPKTGKGYEAKKMEDHLRMKKMGYTHEKPKMEAYEMGTKEYADHTKKITPGQTTEDWNKQVDMMQEKNNSMRSILADMWGVNEGKNPFEKNIDEKKEMGFKVEFGKGDDAGMAVYRDKKDAEAFAKRQPKPIKITKGMYDRFDEEDKTMTGKPATKVSVDPDMEEKRK